MKTLKIIISIILALGFVSTSMANPRFKNKKPTRPTTAHYENVVKVDESGPAFKNTATQSKEVESTEKINTNNANNLKGPKFKNIKK